MISYESIKSRLPFPRYRDKQILRNQTTNDIVTEMLNSYYLFSDQGRHVADQFMSSTPYKTGKKLHQFFKDNINYKIEPESLQTSKSLIRYINDREGDCKHYSLAIASILKFIPLYDKFCFRFVSYEPGSNDYSHVYIVAYGSNGEQIIIDPLQTYNDEKTFFSKLDKCFKPVALNRLSGMRNPTNLMKFSNAGTHCGCGGSVGCCDSMGASFAKKLLAAPTRNAFLALVRLNPLKIGTKTKTAYQKDPEKLRTWWQDKFGGSWTSLVNAIESVHKLTTEEKDQSIQEYGGETRTDARKEYCDAKYPWSISPWSKRQKCYNHKINGAFGEVATGAGAAALLVAAAPVLVALTALIKQMGGGEQQEWSEQAQQNYNNTPGGSGGAGFDIMQYLPLIALGGAAYFLLKK